MLTVWETTPQLVTLASVVYLERIAPAAFR